MSWQRSASCSPELLQLVENCKHALISSEPKRPSYSNNRRVAVLRDLGAGVQIASFVGSPLPIEQRRPQGLKSYMFPLQFVEQTDVPLWWMLTNGPLTVTKRGIHPRQRKGERGC